ncbi:MAG: TIR domain-containing protein [Paludibacteraceae bacterium]|nr:TIR domain-containing protein [Paludibacteraceae bacterium]
MKKKIEHPKVFISYAWGTEEHKMAVTSFATQLKMDGVDVIYDRWSLKEGNDTYDFMEKSVKDPSITNVLILLDPTYAKKADARDGGVGTETQIISTNVYADVAQDKFIPIVFGRDEQGNICKPQYLQGRLHFDLTKSDKSDIEYKRLVRRLFGIDSVREPELGNPPDWLEDEPPVEYEFVLGVEKFKGNLPDKEKQKEYRDTIKKIVDEIEDNEISGSAIDQYKSLLPLRDKFLMVVANASCVNEGYKIIADTLESLVSVLYKNEGQYSVQLSLVHELFLYIVALFLKEKEWDALKYLLNKTYFVNYREFRKDGESFNVFAYNNDRLDREMRERDGKNYYCGTAQYWMDNLNLNICNREALVFADLFCYNCSFLIKNYTFDWKWFPVLYVYGNRYCGELELYVRKFASKEHLTEIATITGYSTIESFIERYAEIEKEVNNGKTRTYRYNSAFDEADTFWRYLRSDELGTRN